LATALSDALAGPAPKVTGHYRLGDVRHITASSKRIADELSWRATVSFEQGMTELAHD
jgi:dTDP-L-rhamnose 4-epimerase